MRIKTQEAAVLLGLPVQTLRVFLQLGKFKEFAEAVKIGTSKYFTFNNLAVIVYHTFNIFPKC